MKKAHELMEKMLIDAAEILKRDNRLFWVEYGTLLGFVREGGFIEWERDVDLGVWKDNKDLAYKKKLSADFKKLGYKVCFSDGHLHIYCKNTEANVELDINFYTTVDNMAVKPIYIPRNKLGVFLKRFLWSLYDLNTLKFANNRFQAFLGNLIIIIPTVLFHLLPAYLREIILPKIAKIQNASFFINKSNCVPSCYFAEFRNFEIFGIELPIPKESESYLEYKFGHDWRTPKKQWDSFSQDKALLGNE